MSWQAYDAVTYHSKQASERLLRLLLIFAGNADGNGRIDPAPSQDTLAEMFDVTERTIRNWLNELLASGELERTRRGRGEGNASAYQINLPMPVPGGSELTGNHEEMTGSYEEKDSSYEETNPGNISGNFEERLKMLEEKMGAFFPVIEQLQEKLDELTGITGNVNRKRYSFKSADDPTLDPTLDPEDPPPNPPRGKSRGDFYGDLLPRWGDLAKLAEIFTAVSGIQPPHAGANYAARKIRDRWLIPLAEIEDMANGSTETLIRRAVDYMRQSGLTIADPHSIVNVSRSIYHNKNGPPAGKKSDADQFDFSTATDTGW